MNIAIFAITVNGAELAQKLANYLKSVGYPAEVFVNIHGQHLTDTTIMNKPVKDYLQEAFKKYDALCCIMALGIVMRTVGPLTTDKATDPAVLVMDEQGKFVISALSGHLGGANILTEEIAKYLNAQPVITTASDVQGKYAIDEIARELGWILEPMKNIVVINSQLVNGGTIKVLTDQHYPIDFGDGYKVESFCDDVRVVNQNIATVLITNRVVSVSSNYLITLRPRNLLVGLGCRRDTSAETIKSVIEEVFAKAGLSINSIKSLSSISAKADEVGLLEIAGDLGVPLRFFTSDEINNFTNCYNKSKESKDRLAWSQYVYDKMGVGGVCEPVALMNGTKTRLLVGKTNQTGVTVAIAVENCL